MGQGKRDRHQKVSEASAYPVGDRIGVRIAQQGRHVQRLDARRLIEFLDSNMRASAYTGGAKMQLTRFCLRRHNELSNSSNTRRLACDEHVGLLREWNDRDEILQRVIREVLQERRTVCLSVGVYQQRVTVGC